MNGYIFRYIHKTWVRRIRYENIKDENKPVHGRQAE